MALDIKLTKFTTTSPMVATFSFNEIASGEGFIEFLGFADSKDNSVNASATISLVSTAFKTVIVNNVGITSTAAELSFKTPPFNLQRTVKGIAYVYFLIIHKTVGGGGTRSYTATVDIFHNTTNIGTATSDVLTTVAANSTGTGNGLLAITLTESNVKEGDTITVRITSNQTNGTGGDGTGFVFDPLDRDLAADSGWPAVTASEKSTQLNASIPFKIEP